MIKVMALLYYGRANPEWTLNSHEEMDFRKLFNKIQFQLNPVSVIEPPKYGYTGFIVNVDDKNYYIYREKVESKNTIQYGFDGQRLLETLLVKSAPMRIREHLTFF